ncbi:MAG: hypothetical protein NZ934_04405 [Hadesarchaea archaeon]|nr:hypothetical protein [Hadesarchaea archaeon]
MRIEVKGRRIASVLLASALVLSLALAMTPVFAPRVLESPAGTVVTVEQGRTFTLRHKLRFDQPGKGTFAISIYWESPSAEENFRVENVAVYWENGSPVENVRSANYRINFLGDPKRPGWQVDVETEEDKYIWANGVFFVDVTLRAASGDGTPHRPTDEHLLYYGADMILMTEDTILMHPAPPITVRVAQAPIYGVRVEVSPNFASGPAGARLNYIIRVTNTSNRQDVFYLSVQDNAGWGPTVSPKELTISAGESKTAELTLILPPNAPDGAEDKIIVTATSRENAELSASDVCIARVAAAAKVREVRVSISPKSRSGLPGETLSFTVSIKNLGNIEDSYTLEIAGGSGWSPRIDTSKITLPAGGTGEATLLVTVPLDANEGDTMELTLTATSLVDPSATASYTCRAIVGRTRFPTAAVVLAIIAAIATGLTSLIVKYRGREKRKRPRVLGSR